MSKFPQQVSHVDNFLKSAGYGLRSACAGIVTSIVFILVLTLSFPLFAFYYILRIAFKDILIKMQHGSNYKLSRHGEKVELEKIQQQSKGFSAFVQAIVMKLGNMILGESLVVDSRLKYVFGISLIPGLNFYLAPAAVLAYTGLIVVTGLQRKQDFAKLTEAHRGSTKKAEQNAANAGLRKSA